MTWQEAILKALIQLGNSEQTANHKINQLWLTLPMHKLHELIPVEDEKDAVASFVQLVHYYRENPKELKSTSDAKRTRRRNQ